MTSLLILFVAIVSGLLGTWGSRSIAHYFNIVNNPNSIVPQHTKAIAYLGGLGIYLGILFIVVATYSLSEMPLLFLGLSGGYMILGIIDDLTVMTPAIKFTFQLALAILSVSLGVKYAFTNILWLDMTLSAFWILVLVNAYNLTDVCDGLVGGLSIVSTLVIFFLVSDAGILPLIVSGATIGFLFFNAPPASIFMGDAGSHLLGFILAYFSLTIALGDNITFDFLPLASLSGVMLFELVFLIYTRTKKNLKWWQGSNDHFSLRLQAHGWSKWKTNIFAWFLGTLCGLPMLLTFFDCKLYVCLLSIVLILAIFLKTAHFLLQIEARNKI